MNAKDLMPRLSHFIHTNGSVTRPPDRLDECHSDEDFYRLQRHRVLQQIQNNILPLWFSVKESVKDYAKNQSISDKAVNDLLRQMLDIGRSFAGLESSMDLVESSTVYILQVFHDSKYIKQIFGVTSYQINEFEKIFGKQSINNNLVNKAFDLTKQLFELIDNEERERLFMPYKDSLTAFHSNNISNDKNLNFVFLSTCRSSRETVWGKEYKDLQIDPFEDNQKIVVEWDSIVTEDEQQQLNNKKFDLCFEYKDSNNTKSVNSSQTVLKPTHNKYNIEWLNKELTKYIDGYNDAHNEPFYLNIENLVETVMSWMKTQSKSDEELGADLFNLLGETCFTIIEYIVKYRKEITNSYNQIYSEDVSQIDLFKEKVKTQSNNLIRDKRPAITQSVVVHTEEEKNLKKQIRKMEKKLNKDFYRDSDFSNPSLNLNDIEHMRHEREKALMLAMCGPLFKEESEEILDQREYPYVFDTNIEVKSTPAFIAGAKMKLPIGFVRNDQRRWEEITIPAPPPPPENIIENYKLINIEDLDEFCKIGFKGLKTLNRIQSIVYKTAYTTGANMLICAPTGAGKTNAAMLVILHEVKANSPTNSVNDINLDRFKIVYIAPMKALASEMTDNFSKKLAPFGIKVRELTGDMQLSKTEIMNTQILVTTPEKWDVVTRKAKGDVQLLQLVRVIIIDEVHLLQSDRGPVLEALVARTVRYIESTQMCIRMIGLSATLPNYRDVAEFLHVNHRDGLFYFDNRFRPAPLTQTFIGYKATQLSQQVFDMDEVTFEKVHEDVAKGHQVMVFVHARNATLKTAITLRDRASKSGYLEIFKPNTERLIGSEQMMRRARHKQLPELFMSGFAIHHAGMLRPDRNLVEKLFRVGVIKVLVCTSTLAWGVNLPAHSVIIKGTEMYDSSQGKFVDISMLDVMQIFGRAGRPQYDTDGHGTIVTEHSKLRHYLSLLTNQYPIESNFLKFMTDNMNAEIVSGTITTIDEAVDWIRDTYLFIRMRKNPIVYGISADQIRNDPEMFDIRRKLVISSAEDLDKAKMVRYSPEAGTLDPTDLGRTASHYYIKYDTIEKFNEIIAELMDERQILGMISHAQEFDQLKSREDEFEELTQLLHSDCKLGVAGGVENKYGKVNILMQSYLSRAKIDSFSLISDSMFVMQNVNRITRGLFEYTLKKGWPLLAQNLLKLSLMFDRRMWDYETPLRQFESEISFEVMTKLEKAKLSLTKIREMSADEIGRLVKHQSYGSVIKRLADTLPNIEIKACLKPITRTVLMVQLELTPTFRWNDKYHGKVCESFWLWLVDIESNHIYHSELFKFTKKQVVNREIQKLTFNIPLLDPDNIPNQYLVHCAFDKWLGCEFDISIKSSNLILPEKFVPFTKLLDLDPLPVSALNNELYESVYNRFTHFNPIQTQIFHTLYHTDTNVLLGAPTGSGKTIAAEIAMFRVFNTSPNSKIVYIAPMKALVRERVDDWKVKIERQMGRKVVELTGDVTPDLRAINDSDIIVTTPEKWDGVSRNWQTRKYVRDVALIVIDEIHLLGEDRGPVLEVIVSRTNFICQKTQNKIRIIGLSTAIANAQDLAHWLNIKKIGLYNFKPSVRPVPIEVHVAGYPGKNYCPRMALMNKPTYRAILQHSPEKPVLVFVSSRRQTRLTALDLIAFLSADQDSFRFLHMERNEMTALIQNVRDSNLKITLDFGIGLHHAGLHERDRALVEELFTNQKIQILITTATLAWGVNLPAHCVIIKGTEYYDGKKQTYVDFPITDVLQMMGRAGRPQFDTSGVAVVLVHDIKKEFYKKFLYEPFPVESSLLSVLSSHLNAEIVSGTIDTKQSAIEYMDWTYLFRRILKNPFYYGLESCEINDVNTFLSSIISTTLETLVNDYCITIDDDERTLRPTFMGRIASYYYLHHSTVRMFYENLINTTDKDFSDLLQILTNAEEYNELPVRHNENILNQELANHCPMKLSRASMDCPHTKAHLLLQAHISRLHLPSTDFLTDLKSVLDQAIRIIQAMIDVSALSGSLPTTLKIITLLQMIVQSRWVHENPLLTLPNVNEDVIYLVPKTISLPELVYKAINNGFNSISNTLKNIIDELVMHQIFETLVKLPLIEVSLTLLKTHSEDESMKTTPISIPLDSYYKSFNFEQKWINVEPNTDYTLKCSFVRIGKRRDNTRAVAPKFPKIKDESWFMLLGDCDKSDLIAMRRFGFIGDKPHPINSNLLFKTPSESGKIIYYFYFISDSYLGLDQQYQICLDVR